jgi:hypothetical protein
MLWPPPVRGESVTLRCACRATILWRLPLAFLYSVRIVQRESGCTRSRHILGKRTFTALETIVSRDEPHPSTSAPV